MKIATYNIQNLFHRNAQLVKKNLGHNLRSLIEEFESLLKKKTTRSDDELERLEDLSMLLGFQQKAYQPHLVMRRKAGKLYVRKRSIVPETVPASPFTQWSGWIPLTSLPINEAAVLNKARVVKEADADILLLQEVEDRHSLKEFDLTIQLDEEGHRHYAEHYVLEGNDLEGRHLGMMTKAGQDTISLFTHCHALNKEGWQFFDRDFQTYGMLTASGQKLWLFSALLKMDDREKEASDTRRRNQAIYIADTYQKLRELGYDNIVVAGTFNAPSYCSSLAPLLQDTDLRDVGRHPSFSAISDMDADGSYFRMGAYGKGVNLKQLDYLLLSPALWEKVIACGMDRKAVWPEKRPKWPIYPSMKNREQQASRHPLLWCEVDV